MKVFTVGLVAALAAGAYAGEIETTVLRQQWPWQKDVRIDYMLTGLWGETCDIEVAVKDGDKVVERSTDAFFGAFDGDLHEVSVGSRTIWWHPDVSRHGAVNAKALTFTLTPKTVSAKGDYMVIDISDSSHYTVSYLKEVPSGGWRASKYNNVYTRTKLVLRRIRAGKFMMGSPETEAGRPVDSEMSADLYNENLHEVTLTKDFWIGVYPLTLQQVRKIWPLIAPSDASTYALEGKSYARVNSHSGDLDFAAWFVGRFEMLGLESSTKWPQSYDVDDQSICGMLRSRTAGEDLEPGYVFAMPTEAQWEYACRAGTTTAYYNGYDPEVGVDGNDPHLDLIAKYTKAKPDAEWQGLGARAPNAWGLYDMLGDSWELVMDVGNWDTHGLGFNPVSDPRGPNPDKSSCYNFLRGGGWNAARFCRAAARTIGQKVDSSTKDATSVRIAFVAEN